MKDIMTALDDKSILHRKNGLLEKAAFSVNFLRCILLSPCTDYTSVDKCYRRHSAHPDTNVNTGRH